jgi:hypothetical protein
VGTFPLEADTSFKVVGCLEYILHNIWELLTDFSALPTRTAFWVHIEYKIEQIRRKTLYIKIKDGNPSIKSTRQMGAQVDTTQKKKKGVEGKLDNCATIGGSSRCSTKDWEPDTKWRGNAMKDMQKHLGSGIILLFCIWSSPRRS